MQVAKLIRELSKFPDKARVTIFGPTVRIRRGADLIRDGVIHLPSEGRPRKTQIGDMEGWQSDETDGDKVRQWLRANPDKAAEIAFAAVAGMVLDHRAEDVLPEEESYPRGSGSDYVEDVNCALTSTGAEELLKELRERRYNSFT